MKCIALAEKVLNIFSESVQAFGDDSFISLLSFFWNVFYLIVAALCISGLCVGCSCSSHGLFSFVVLF